MNRHASIDRSTRHPAALGAMLAAAVSLAALAAPRAAQSDAEARAHAPIATGGGADGWIPLFNGRDLDDWVIKVKGQPLGVDPLHTARVEDGVLRMAYDEYGRFEGRFAHLFHRLPWSDYRLRVEYRFVGEQTPGGPGWAWRNSGVMLHCQAPETMRTDQDFPVSIEVQFLGGDGEHPRSTANLCTPGTNVEMGGELVVRHCTDADAPTFPGDQWVVVEAEVHGGDIVRHLVDGKVVIEYEHPQLDPNDADAKRLIGTNPDGTPALRLAKGWIALQGESHPVEFRRVEILPLRPE